MNVNLPTQLAQRIVAYASIVFGVLTTTLSGIHLPPAASAILGVFGILLHPGTSITSSGTAQAAQPTTYPPIVPPPVAGTPVP